MTRLLLKLVDAHDPELLRRALAWLYGFVRPQLRAIAVLLGLSLGASLLVLAQPWLTKTLIDEGLLDKDFGLLVQVAVEVVAQGEEDAPGKPGVQVAVDARERGADQADGDHRHRHLHQQAEVLVQQALVDQRLGQPGLGQHQQRCPKGQ
ncbi:hypothetical protein R0G64_17480, partial [Pseudomonas otitidis]|nr:hypothetical protein [Pseudomonas otitidis]